MSGHLTLTLTTCYTILTPLKVITTRAARSGSWVKMIDYDCITFQTSSSEKMSSAQVKIRIKQYGYGYKDSGWDLIVQMQSNDKTEPDLQNPVWRHKASGVSHVPVPKGSATTSLLLTKPRLHYRAHYTGRGFIQIRQLKDKVPLIAVRGWEWGNWNSRSLVKCELGEV